MIVDGQTFIRRFEDFAPKWLAEKGDPVGLRLGTLNKPIHKVLVTLDVRPEVVAEAITEKVDLIFAHHPILYGSVKNLMTDDPQNKMYADLLKHDIAVYAAHTNLDVATGGMNDWLSQALSLHNTEVMTVTHKEPYKKLAVFVPTAYADILRRALAKAGAGKIGPNYEACSYTVKGKGRFTPTAEANPFIGKSNEAEVTEEEKIEVIFPERLTTQIEKAMFDVHPYEEPTYDVYTIENYKDIYGLGRVGDLTEKMTVREFAEKCKMIFDIAGLRLTTFDEDELISRVAVCGGDGGKFYPDALAKGAQVYITGDVYYHTAHDMLAEDLHVIDPGHHIESICKEKLSELFIGWASEYGWDLTVTSSKLNTDPFNFI